MSQFNCEKIHQTGCCNILIFYSFFTFNFTYFLCNILTAVFIRLTPTRWRHNSHHMHHQVVARGPTPVTALHTMNTLLPSSGSQSQKFVETLQDKTVQLTVKKQVKYKICHKLICIIQLICMIKYLRTFCDLFCL